VFNVELDSSVSGPEYYHPGRSISNNDLVRAGELHPDFAEEYKFRHRVYIAEIDVDALFQSKNQQAVQPIAKFPSVRGDFSLILGKGTRYADVEYVVRDSKIPELIRIDPFDRLEVGPFPESKYALAISLVYQSVDRTLTDGEVETFDKAILNSLKQRLGAELRQ